MSEASHFQSRISVLIPAFNEAENIQSCLRDLQNLLPNLTIIVIDDGSTDDTARLVREIPQITLIQHRRNSGYGSALKSGIRTAQTEFVVWFDADGQHHPKDILGLVEPILNNEYDVMLGERTKGSAYIVKRMPGKWLLKLCSQIVARERIPDLNCGFRCFRTSTIRRYLHLLPDGFSASATSTLIMLRRGYRVGFLPIQTAARTGTSTVRFRDGLKTLALILRIMLLFDALLFFSFCALLQIIPALIYSWYKFITVGLGLPPLGVLVLISGILTFFIGLISSQISEMRLERFEFDTIGTQKNNEA